jgi:RimJ/RimL family protein N-acetyltransferase
VEERDLPTLYDMAVAPETADLWLFRGATPSPGSFALGIPQDVHLQLVADHPRDGVIALFVAYDAQLHDRHVSLAAVSAPSQLGRGRVFLALGEFLDRLFDSGLFDKVYLEVPEYTLPAFRAAEGYWALEGRLRSHRYFGGSYHDVLVLAISRERWAARIRLVAT